MYWLEPAVAEKPPDLVALSQYPESLKGASRTEPADQIRASALLTVTETVAGRLVAMAPVAWVGVGASTPAYASQMAAPPRELLHENAGLSAAPPSAILRNAPQIESATCWTQPVGAP